MALPFMLMMGCAVLGQYSSCSASLVIAQREPSFVLPSHRNPSSGLAVISFWRATWMPSPSQKIAWLHQAVAELRTWPGHLRVVLVANQHTPVDGVDEQVIRPVPQCEVGGYYTLCMPWEAIRVLKQMGGQEAYTHYAYLEGDIAIPATTFNMWWEHNEGLYARGYLLVTHRRHFNAQKQEFITDCSGNPTGPCGEPLWDKGQSSETCPTNRSIFWVRPFNSYNANFLMNHAQFQEYLASEQSEYLTSGSREGPPWGKQENAAGGLRWASKYGKNKILTLTSLPVYHLSGLGQEVQRATRFDEQVERCVSGCNCSVLK